MIQLLAHHGLGLNRGEVRLLEHDPAWSLAFDALKSRFVAPGMVLHHIGSTSIPGIRAKPVLDILGEVESMDDFDRQRGLVESFGFTWKGEYGISGRRYAVLYDEAELLAFVHLHAFEQGHAEIMKHLLFRDRLCARRDLAAEYDRLKIDLASIYPAERSRYTEAKNDFISRVLAGCR